MTKEQVAAVRELSNIEGIRREAIWELSRIFQPRSMYIRYFDDKNNTIFAGEVSRNGYRTTFPKEPDKMCEEANYLEARLRYIAQLP